VGRFDVDVANLRGKQNGGWFICETVCHNRS
jgi:hypothetical protein